ncbi:MAG: hypothetical protein ACREJQ_06940, partial [bacterium]
GRFGFSMMLYTFDIFERYSHASSPYLTLNFAYDPGVGRYVPVIDENCTADSDAVDGSTKTLEELNEKTKITDKTAPHLDDSFGEYLSALIAEVVPFFFQGHAEAAWRIFDQEYRMSDKDDIREAIQRQLDGSPIYREVLRLAKEREARCKKGKQVTGSSQNKEDS